MAELFTVDALISLLTLTVLEIVLGIDNDAALIVEYKSGEICRLTSGEISIKVKQDENK